MNIYDWWTQEKKCFYLNDSTEIQTYSEWVFIQFDEDEDDEDEDDEDEFSWSSAWHKTVVTTHSSYQHFQILKSSLFADYGKNKEF